MTIIKTSKKKKPYFSCEKCNMDLLLLITICLIVISSKNFKMK